MRVHEVSFSFGRQSSPVAMKEIIDFTVVNDMQELADQWAITMPFRRELWELSKADTRVEIMIDQSKILDGFIDSRRLTVSRGGETIQLSGRDKGGRLVDESAPLGNFRRIGIQQLAERMVGDWFGSVSLSNASNRQLIRGPRATKARVSSEPPILSGSNIEKKVSPGESRASVLQHFLEEAELLAWSSASGEDFIIGLPNYSQAPQFKFFHAKQGSDRSHEANVIEFDYGEDITDRYSEIEVCGSSRGDGVNYGPNVTKRRASVTNGTGTGGIGNDFQFKKYLLVPDNDVRSAGDAQTRAEREMTLRDAAGRELDMTVKGFGQPYLGNGAPAIYAFDTAADWEIESIGLRETFHITRVEFRESLAEGQRTSLRLVPRGTELAIS